MDLGPSAGLPNVVEAKQRLGATRLGFRQWTWEHPLHRLLISGRRRISDASAAVRSLAHSDWFERLRYRWVLFKTARETGAVFEQGVEIRRLSNLNVGPGTIIASGALVHCGGMEWCNNAGGVTIGRDSYIGPHSVLFGAGEIHIGNQVAIGPDVVITSHGHEFSDSTKPILDQPTLFEPVHIEDDVYIGTGAVILHGVRIGRGAVVGAGAVVSSDIPQGAVALGIPARVVRLRDAEKAGLESA